MNMDPNQTDPSMLANGILSPLTSGNYVTSDQVQRMRLYADSLRNNVNTMPVKSGWQGLAQMANAGLSGLIDNQANQQQRQLMQQEADQKATGIFSQFPNMTGAAQPNPGQTPAPQSNPPAASQSVASSNNSGQPDSASAQAYAASVAPQYGIDPKAAVAMVGKEYGDGSSYSGDESPPGASSVCRAGLPVCA